MRHDEIAAIPAGPPDADGADGSDGVPGEVSAADLAAVVANTPHTPTGVSPLGLAASDPPTVTEVQQFAVKLDELITALRREP